MTQTEHKEEWGGKKDPSTSPLPRLSFNFCPLSLQPIKDPVCTPDGTMFDILNIIPYIKQFGKNPVNGKLLKVDDLIKLQLFKDDQDNFICPVSRKIFTDASKIVAVKPSGVVYAGSTVEELNKKPKFFFDLVTSRLV